MWSARPRSAAAPPWFNCSSNHLQASGVWQPTCLYPRRMRARLLSIMIHLGVIALLIVVSSRSTLINHSGAHPFDRSVRLVLPSPYRGGGGGGERSALPASRGRLPRLALRQFTPPSATPPTTQHPLLVIEPTLIAPADVHLPDVMLAQLGDPLGRLGPPSSGPGSGGGIGDGVDGGVGNKRRPGVWTR